MNFALSAEGNIKTVPPNSTQTWPTVTVATSSSCCCRCIASAWIWALPVAKGTHNQDPVFYGTRTRCANIFLLARNDIHNFYLLSLCILRSFILITQRGSSLLRYSFFLFLSQHRTTFRILNEISRRHICNLVAGGVKSCGPQKILYCVRKQARGGVGWEIGCGGVVRAAPGMGSSIWKFPLARAAVKPASNKN